MAGCRSSGGRAGAEFSSARHGCLEQLTGACLWEPVGVYLRTAGGVVAGAEDQGACLMQQKLLLGPIRASMPLGTLVKHVCDTARRGRAAPSAPKATAPAHEAHVSCLSGIP
eukprot:1153895-Pelagomonas_calceolata.AAC.6